MKGENAVFDSETTKIKHIKHYSFEQNSSIGVGGSAVAAFYPDKISQLVFLIERFQQRGVPYVVLGNTTNVLPPDGKSENVLLFTTGLCAVGFGETTFALCGTTTEELLNECEVHGKTGAEFLQGIPATVGGAAFMNAGACGKHVDDVVESVLAYKEGKIRVLSKAECEYGYKKSVFMDENIVILGVSLLLETCSPDFVRENRLRFESFRKHLPKGKSMGCVFKNPEGKNAGKLIEGAGLKGLKKGGAFVSTEHANFIINGGGATARDVQALINLCKSAVFAQYGVRLEEEIRYLT